MLKKKKLKNQIKKPVARQTLFEQRKKSENRKISIMMGNKNQGRHPNFFYFLLLY